MKLNGGKRWQTMVNNGTPVEEPTVQQQTKLQTNLASLIITLPTIFWVKCHGQWRVNISELFFFSRASKGPKSISKDCLSTIKVLASASMLPLNPSEWFQLSWLLRLSNRCGDDFDGSGPGLILQQCTLTKESGLVRFPGRHEFGVKLGQFPEIIKRQKDAKGMF